MPGRFHDSRKIAATLAVTLAATLAVTLAAFAGCRSDPAESAEPATELGESTELAAERSPTDGVPPPGAPSQDSDLDSDLESGPASYTETIRGTDVRFELVWVPEGRFWIGKTEVTWDEYLLFCDWKEERLAPPHVDAVSRPSYPQEDVALFDHGWGTGKRPAVGISWNAAKKYCRWLTANTGREYRLPTEAEWEIACGRDAENTDAHAWHLDNCDDMTQEVGQKLPNRHGVHDMFGNLWEYCADPFDPKEPDIAVLRGGSWFDSAEEITFDSRLRFEEDWTLDDPNVPPGVWWVPEGDMLGFRVLRKPKP